MIIKYYSATPSKYIVEHDLSKETIEEWYIDKTDYKPEGFLSILFDTTGIDTPCTGGVCPPISGIINLDEVMEYLNNNFKKLESEIKCFDSEDIMNAYILEHGISGHIFTNKKPDKTCKIRYFKNNKK